MCAVSTAGVTTQDAVLQSLAYQQVIKPDPKHTKKMGAIFTFSILRLLILPLFQVSKFESVCKFAQQSIKLTFLVSVNISIMEHWCIGV